MLSLTLHVVQVLGVWEVRATVTRSLGSGFEPEVLSGSSSLPLTGLEWDADDLSAVLSAVARWSGLTIDGATLNRLD
jgi:hypothetical protein